MPAILAPRSRSKRFRRAPMSQCGGRSPAGSGSPHERTTGLSSGPAPSGTSSRGRIGDEEEVRLELRLHEGELRVQGRDPVPERAERRLARLRLVGLAGRGPAPPPRCCPRSARACAASAAASSSRRRPSFVEQPVDDLGAFSLAGDGRLDGVRIVADGLDRDHDASPAARSRSSTKGRSSDASSQPARGPEGAPQERSVQGGEGVPLPRSRAPWPWRRSPTGRPPPPIRSRPGPPSPSPNAAQYARWSAVEVRDRVRQGVALNLDPRVGRGVGVQPGMRRAGPLVHDHELALGER